MTVLCLFVIVSDGISSLFRCVSACERKETADERKRDGTYTYKRAVDEIMAV